MSSHQETIDHVKQRLEKWNNEINSLEDKVKTPGADNEAEYQRNLSALKLKRDKAAKKLEELKTTSDSVWEGIKDGFEHAYTSISHAMTSVKDRLFTKKHS